MILRNIEANGYLFDVEINNPLFELLDVEERKLSCQRVFQSIGLTYDNIDEMNKNGSWAIAYKAGEL